MDRDEACRIVFDYLCLRHQPEKANVIFILGGSTFSPTEKAATLYKAGFAPAIAFTDVGGTFGPTNKVQTIDWYRENLLELGIPRTTMVWAPLSHNTLEEARVAIPFLREMAIDPRKVLLVARPIHQRRAWATFQKQWPRIKFVSCPADEPFDLTETSRLLAELDRLEKYASAGDLLPQIIPPEVQAAREVLARAQ